VLENLMENTLTIPVRTGIVRVLENLMENTLTIPVRTVCKFN